MPVDWAHPAWVGGFYPEDLPEEWRLGYFANEFSAVVVPHASWIDAEPDLLQSWVDDVSDSFRFFLELTSPVEVSLCDKQASILMSNFGGYIVDAGLAREVWGEGFAVINKQRGSKTFWSTAASMLAPLPRLPHLEMCGRAFSFNSKNLGDLAAQRGFFEQLRDAVQPNAEVLLSVSGSPPSIESIRKLQLLGQLMGLA